MTTQTTKDFDELRAKVDAELAKEKVEPKCECRVCEKTVCPDDVICWSCAMKMKGADE